MRKDTVDGDAVALELKGQDTGEGHNTGFGDGVGSDVRCGDERGARRDIDNGAAPRAQQVRHRGVAGQVDGAQVKVEHVIPCGFIGLMERPAAGEAADHVDQRIEVSERGDRFIDEACQRRIIGGIDALGEEHVGTRAKLRTQRLRILVLAVGHRHTRALGHEQARHGAAQHACAARDHGHAILQQWHLSPLPFSFTPLTLPLRLTRVAQKQVVATTLPFDQVSLPDCQHGRPGRLSDDEALPHPTTGMSRQPTEDHVAAGPGRHEGKPLRFVILRDPVDGIRGLRVLEGGFESCLGNGRVIGDHFDAVRGGTAHRAQHSDQRQAYSLDDGGPVLLPHVQADVAWHPARCRRAPRRVATMCPPSQRDTGVVGVGVIHCTQ